MSKRVFVGIGSQRLLSGQKGIPHQLVWTRRRLGFGEMVRQLLGVGLSVISIQRFQGLRDSGVQPYPAARSHPIGQGLLNQRVAELVAVHLAGYLLDQMEWHRLVYRLEQLVFGHCAVENIQQAEIKLPSDDGSAGQQLVALRRQPVKPLPDHLPDAIGNP